VGREPTLLQRADHLHRRPDRRRRGEGPSAQAEAGRLPPPVHSRPHPRRRRGEVDRPPPGDGLQQAKDYAEILKLKFAYATNGREILEFDYLTGKETLVDRFPTPAELWQRFLTGSPLDQDTAKDLLTPSYHLGGKSPRYYQEIAINRALMAILSGKNRVLLTMATGTGKTFVAFQICWKLWNARWNRTRAHRRPKILFLADRNVLIDDPKDKTFTPFGDARWKIENGKVVKSREMYFAIYQAIAQDQNRPGLYREFSPDFLRLLTGDHRGNCRV
jgi:type I restriction enzyme R subunit